MFYLEEPSLERKEDALGYLQEHRDCNANMQGDGGLKKCGKTITYEEWLEKLEKCKSVDYAKSINRCPSLTYFLVRHEDDRIIGMINIRFNLNSEMLKLGGNIGYGIRPSDIRHGYNKINLYLGLLKAREKLGLSRVMISSDVSNLGSDKTIKALGGVLDRHEVNQENGELANVYWIDVDDAIEKYRDVYLPFINIGRVRR